jgi:hypothetical protein
MLTAPSVGNPREKRLTPINGIASALAIAAALALAACQPAPPTAVPAPPPAAPAPAATAKAPPAGTPAPSVRLPAMDLPAGPIYACDVAGVRTPIVLADNIEGLCRRHPEMSPCQYERNQCRARGGRVYTARGDEVTAAVEAEYDRRVQRIVFPADSPRAKR